VVFTGGGTGGHIYPGLAVAEALLRIHAPAERSLSIVWFGSNAPMDRKLVEQGGLSAVFYAVPAGKFRRYVSLKTFFDLFKIAAGFVVSFFLLLRLKPVVLFSKGGYVSVPPCFAAKLLGIPVFIHECDFTPGLATKLTSRVARRVFVSYAETARYFSERVRAKITVTGNPIRSAFYEEACDCAARKPHQTDYVGCEATDERHDVAPTLLIIGGSLGAKQINDLVAENLTWLCGRFEVVHQTGNQAVDSGAEEALSEGLKQNYRRVQFFYDDFPRVLNAAAVVLSRAGASAVWECAVCGRPMVLIPLGKQGSRGDQIDNAAYFAERGAALVLNSDTVTSDALKAALETVLDAGVRRKMSEAARKIAGTVRPAETIADILSMEVNGQ
jgi:UDP-N-acetylglucosamine--N-acetylmuramyl-(pentapeptide) pyrophosphoryl-undecaprenol N-acetylglucosamine transferase